MKHLISVIVPIYKVESFLTQCIESIVNQTYKYLEIILVDDGSPDRCGQICDEYKEKDSRIKVIHKQNEGVSAARNIGLDIMTGTYLVFVDSDDWLPLNGIELLYNEIIDKNADLVIGSYELMDEKGIFLESFLKKKTGILSVKEIMEEILEEGCRPWARIYHQRVHKEVKFPVGEIHEDEAVVMEVLDRCNKIAVTNQCVYYYRYRNESIVTSSFSKKKLDWKKQCKKNYFYLKNKYPELQNKAAARYRDSLLWSLGALANQSDIEIYREEINEMIDELKCNKKLFLNLPFRYPRYKMRLKVLADLGFDRYYYIVSVVKKIKKQ